MPRARLEAGQLGTVGFTVLSSGTVQATAAIPSVKGARQAVKPRRGLVRSDGADRGSFGPTTDRRSAVEAVPSSAADARDSVPASSRGRGEILRDRTSEKVHVCLMPQ